MLQRFLNVDAATGGNTEVAARRSKWIASDGRVQDQRNFYMIFICKLLHPAPLMNSPSSSTCSHLLLVTSSHLDFPGGVMTRLSSQVGVQALLGHPGFRA